MYEGGRPGVSARRSNRVMAYVAASGVLGWWCVRLETVNPVSRTALTLPLVTVKVEGRRYLVSMLGQGARWVRNVRAAGGSAVIVTGRRHAVHLVEVPAERRASIIKAYLGRAPGARPHIPVDQDAPLADFEEIAADFPVFEVQSR
jgi:hypothetical protein